MNELAGRRAAAYAHDCIGYAAIAGCTVPLGLIAHASGWGSKRTFVLAASAVPPIAATLLAARREADTGATWGKRRYGLTVTDRQGSVPGFGRSLLRNTAKVAVPWQFGHTLAVGAAFGGFDRRDPLTLAAAWATYPLLAAMAASVVFGKGRALHDRVAQTEVKSDR